MKRREPKPASLPVINQVYFGCAQRESVTQALHMHKSHEKKEYPLNGNKEEQIIRLLKDRDRIFGESVSSKVQHFDVCARNIALSSIFSAHESNDRIFESHYPKEKDETVQETNSLLT